MVRIFCIKHQIEIEPDSHSGEYYCPKCDKYPWLHETYSVLDVGEVVYSTTRKGIITRRIIRLVDLIEEHRRAE